MILSMKYHHKESNNLKMESNNHKNIHIMYSYVISTGIYKPMVKIFETSELGLKCERGIDSEVV
jgi:hypothetical protein